MRDGARSRTARRHHPSRSRGADRRSVGVSGGSCQIRESVPGLGPRSDQTVARMATALPCLGFALPAATHRFDFRYSRTGMVTTTTDADRAVAPAAARRHPRPAPSARSEVLPYPAATGVVAGY